MNDARRAVPSRLVGASIRDTAVDSMRAGPLRRAQNLNTTRILRGHQATCRGLAADSADRRGFRGDIGCAATCQFQSGQSGKLVSHQQTERLFEGPAWREQ